MKNSKRNFVYFVLIAPIIAKILEWFFQLFSGVVQNLYEIGGIRIFIQQIVFLEVLSLIVYLFIFMFIQRDKNFSAFISVIGISYFLKEVFNLIFVTQISLISSSPSLVATMISLIIEPIFMMALIGFIYHLIFKEKILR